MGKIRSVKSLSGRTITHLDENGKKIGVSMTDSSGVQYTHYDADLRKVGTSFKNASGHMTHYDNDWNRSGHSQIMSSGQARHFDASGKQTGESDPNFWGGHDTRKQDPASGGSSSDTDSLYGCLGMILLAALFVVYLFVELTTV